MEKIYKVEYTFKIAFQKKKSQIRPFCVLLFFKGLLSLYD